MKRSLMRYENPHGNPELKRQIAKRMVGQARPAITDEMVITSGCIEAVSLCLQAVGNPGETVVVESPTYPWFLQIIEDQNKFALEIPTDPQTGIDLDQLERAVQKNSVVACLLVPNFHNPLGFEMPDEKKKGIGRDDGRTGYSHYRGQYPRRTLFWQSAPNDHEIHGSQGAGASLFVFFQNPFTGTTGGLDPAGALW